jgi:hypothetical protein
VKDGIELDARRYFVISKDISRGRRSNLSARLVNRVKLYLKI